MTTDDLIALVRTWDGVLVWEARSGDGSPEIAWGDAFLYYAPDGQVPTATQPFATIVAKDYPEDSASRLDRDGVFRLNVAVGRSEAAELTAGTDVAPDALDEVMAHPVYGPLGWVAILNPGGRTEETARRLLRTAYERARTRDGRRREVGRRAT